MERWTPKEAARLGSLAGRGASFRTTLRDESVGVRGERSVRHAARRWGLAFGDDASLSIPLPPDDREILQAAAAERGLSLASFTANLVHTVASERLFKAVLDDEQ